ncbi:MAG: hypothetical protein GWO02_09695, partial [Gammaproteobacteria bacterium]|nr:hypothetical protein [Gammaproteobacteria bacterium]
MSWVAMAAMLSLIGCGDDDGDTTDAMDDGGGETSDMGMTDPEDMGTDPTDMGGEETDMG